MTSSVVETSISDPLPATFSRFKWFLCLLVAGIGTWFSLVHPPIKYELPQELMNVSPNSPPKQQAARKAKEVELHWQNLRTHFAFAGLFYGSVGFLAMFSGIGWPVFVRGMFGNKYRMVIVIATLLIGVAFGVLAGTCASMLRQYIDTKNPLSFLAEETRPLVGDAAVFGVASLLLLVPVGFLLLLSGQSDSKQKSISLLISGLLAGVLTPVLVSVGIVLELIASDHTTEEFPPAGIPMMSLWIAMLVLIPFFASAMVGSRKKKSEEGRA